MIRDIIWWRPCYWYRHGFVVSFLHLLIGSQQATSASFHSHFVTSVDPNASELLDAKVTSVHISQNLRRGISPVCNIFFRGTTLYFWATSDDETNVEGAENDLKDKFYAMTLIVDFLFIFYLIAVSTRGRMAIRDNYQIPGDCISDCIVATVCHPCALSQMARQSANYRDHGYRWCSDTGVDEKFDDEYGLNMSDGVHSMNMSDRDLI